MTPDGHTNRELTLDVGDGHKLYVHDWGNPDATTAIFHLHGGPGSGSGDKYKMQYDPKRQRVIFHDQRGCGRSLPYGSLDHNTTDDLVSDISKIADALDIKTFIIAGGSWGSCLALAYALENPQRVEAMVLDGIFTGSKLEADWLDKGRFQTFYPDAWQAYLDATPAEHREEPSAYHFTQVLGDDEAAARHSGMTYATLEAAVMSLDDRHAPASPEDFDVVGIRTEMYYMQHGCFLADRSIIDKAHTLPMSVYLVQGRYDMVCPPSTAYELAQRLPKSELIWTIGGHQPEHETWNIKRTILLHLTNG